ncbi:MAG TPA: hypothetical protein VIV55_10265 [Flavobacterium sp.]
MKLKATQPIKVFIDRKYYGDALENTQVGKIPENRRINVSWKGCYYIIAPNEEFEFDRCNNWDLSYFKLNNGAEFVIECGRPDSFIESNNVLILQTS